MAPKATRGLRVECRRHWKRKRKRRSRGRGRGCSLSGSRGRGALEPILLRVVRPLRAWYYQDGIPPSRHIRYPVCARPLPVAPPFLKGLGSSTGHWATVGRVMAKAVAGRGGRYVVRGNVCHGSPPRALGATGLGRGSGERARQPGRVSVVAVAGQDGLPGYGSQEWHTG